MLKPPAKSSAISTQNTHEFDYYTAVDDLERAADDEAGWAQSTHSIGDVEFNSACYYKYFNIHEPRTGGQSPARP